MDSNVTNLANRLSLPLEIVKEGMLGFTELVYAIKPNMEKGYEVVNITATEYNFELQMENNNKEVEIVIIAKAWLEEYINRVFVPHGYPAINLTH